MQSKETLKHEGKNESDCENARDGDEVDVCPPVKQQKKLDGKESGKADIAATRGYGPSVDDDEDDIDAAILTSLAQCCKKSTKESASVCGNAETQQHSAKSQSKSAATSFAKITRTMSVSEVSAKLRNVSIDESVVQKLADECVDGEALHNFVAEDFEHFGIKYGPMVKIRSLL